MLKLQTLSMELQKVASLVPLSALAGFIEGATYDAAKLSGTHNGLDVSVIDSKLIRIHRSQILDCQIPFAKPAKISWGAFFRKFDFPPFLRVWGIPLPKCIFTISRAPQARAKKI